VQEIASVAWLTLAPWPMWQQFHLLLWKPSSQGTVNVEIIALIIDVWWLNIGFLFIPISKC